MGDTSVRGPVRVDLRGGRGVEEEETEEEHRALVVGARSSSREGAGGREGVSAGVHRGNPVTTVSLFSAARIK